MKRPASQYYWGDWRSDAALQSCSLTARGLWHEMNCIMHDCEPYGHLVIGGRPMQAAQLARLVGVSPKECAALLAELEQAGVFSRTDDGAIFSRRMVRDERVRNARADGGKAGSEHGVKGAIHGAKGGRPKKPKGGFEGGSKTPLGDAEKPPPSSSSSSSSSKHPPNPPAGGDGLEVDPPEDPPEDPGKPKRERRPRVSLKTFIAKCLEGGEKPISEYRPLLEYVEATGLPMEFVGLAWDVFKAEFLPHGAKSARLQADWRRHFLNYVQKGYYRLWFARQDGTYELSTAGVQAKAFHRIEAA